MVDWYGVSYGIVADGIADIFKPIEENTMSEAYNADVPLVVYKEDKLKAIDIEEFEYDMADNRARHSLSSTMDGWIIEGEPCAPDSMVVLY